MWRVLVLHVCPVASIMSMIPPCLLPVPTALIFLWLPPLVSPWTCLEVLSRFPLRPQPPLQTRPRTLLHPVVVHQRESGEAATTIYRQSLRSECTPVMVVRGSSYAEARGPKCSKVMSGSAAGQDLPGTMRKKKSGLPLNHIDLDMSTDVSPV